MTSQHQPKPILKRSISSCDKAQRIKWDEDNIQLTGEGRGTRQKITEPKTPYIHYNLDSDEVLGVTSEIPPFELTQALEPLASSNFNSSLSTSNSGSNSLSGSSQNLHIHSHYPKAGVASTDDPGMDLDIRNDNGHTGNEQVEHIGRAAQTWSDEESDEEEQTEEEKQRHKRFQMLRSQHYNMKDVLAQRSFDDDDDDEDEENEKGDDLDEPNDDDMDSDIGIDDREEEPDEGDGPVGMEL
ncbi:hypothetical protein BKA69DRAFT_1090858 [Paraphysoderma sedebokerense]|nr:hypothetical protein BKA69DRAFT_1090754 [Paraphysoderma sedebokerense]KAI9138599.1 hypothetical protein BKA69DRAFT_1090858 [Paraphysoderma sedebokerense]